MDCLFCKIIAGEIPSNALYEDEKMYAFYDIDPQSPVHFLVIPKKHIASVDDLEEEDAQLVGEIFLKIKELAKKENLDNGYRVITNIGEDGGQTVPHLHFHVLGGRSLQWPPG
ncbi:histidine triad nucleotide-binding protein [Peptoniphilus sp. KCTC 25270]|uniref:histidine triad nucleotide-binding protein n=1 Tax=Peptoniphilus sp. KCTC 25270 TaxID=2897414 RepID=UPI001E288CE1|nr:histidine triad nucleotide-binding protein [Peptoniphilus sp. KCTC 25270]MCD1146856.1 histidine triad nucleotide-binding protein [Peptoniphilus sp. KCTC 25270]